MSPAELRTLDSLRGWCDGVKARLIHMSIGVWSRVYQRPVRGVEVGVFGGRSLFAAAMGVRDAGSGFILGIDPYTHASALEGVTDEADAQYWLGQVDLPTVLREALAARDALNLVPWCSIVPSPAESVAPFVGSIDYLHIDGNHCREVALRDVKTWVPKVVGGGTVILDDTDWESVREAREYVESICTPTHDGGRYLVLRR